MTKEQLFETLKERFQKVLEENHIENEKVLVVCRSLTPEETIGETQRKDFPILTGKDVMIQAEYKGYKGQAFTDAPSTYEGTLEDILKMDLLDESHDRGIFIATMNAVMASLGYCSCTVHCRKEGPEQCSQDMKKYLENNYPDVKRIGLIGYQPALLEMLANSQYDVRVLDLNPANVGQVRYGVLVEDGAIKKDEILNEYAELILCTGSTLCNGTIINYLDTKQDVLFYGITAAGAARLLGLKSVCFADNYQP